MKAIKDFRQFTDEQEEYLRRVISQLEEGGIPKQTTKTTLQELDKELVTGVNPLKILAVVEKNIPAKFLEGHYIEGSNTAYTREVILSEYLIAN